jgi:hypothetical protein
MHQKQPPAKVACSTRVGVVIAVLPERNDKFSTKPIVKMRNKFYLILGEFAVANHY